MAAPEPTPYLSVIVPVHNGAATLAQCLAAIMGSSYRDLECLVVDDSSTDASRAIAEQFGARVVPVEGGPAGPSHARNVGAAAARGEVLFFVDADVALASEALGRVATVFKTCPDVDALFGSYDASPAVLDFVSQYKNLFHHYFHQQGQEESSTFWSGCGAVRRAAFFAVGGFDAVRYGRPSIEDIDLGCRLRAAGYRIRLCKAVQATHLKRWTLAGMLKSDICDRAIPWTRLIHRMKQAPNDLNLQRSQRLSALLACALVVALLLGAFLQVQAQFLILALSGLLMVSVSAWQWQGGSPLNMSPAKALILAGLLALSALSAGYQGQMGILLSLAVATSGLIVAHFVRPSSTGAQWQLALVVLGLTTGLLQALFSFPYPFPLALLAGVALIVALNHRFYAFFTRQRGWAFAIAVIPFHLFYYLYSVIAFALGTGLHLWKGKRV